MLFVCTPKVRISIVFSFSWGHFNSQEKLKTMLMENFGVTNKEHYGMLWYFLEWSIVTNVEVCMTGFPTRVPRGRLSNNDVSPYCSDKDTSNVTGKRIKKFR